MQLLTSPMPLSPEVIDDRVATVLDAGDNITIIYDDTANVLTISADSGVSGAPVNAEYVTSTADATLSAERVLTDTATVTWDRTIPGQIKATAGGVGGYTNEDAQDAVGGILVDSATIDFLYNDTTPSISGFVKDNSITESMLSLSDNTTKDSTTAAHGLLMKLSGNTVHFLRGDGTWITPPGYTDEQAQDAVASMLTAGTNITLSYNDVANTLTINSSSGTTYTNEEAQDAVGTILVDSSTIDFTYNDATPSITASVIAGSFAPPDAQYITSAVNGTLSAERVLTDTTSVTWDFTVPGQAKAVAVGTGGTTSTAYDLGATWSGTLPASQVILRYPFPRVVAFQATLPGSQARSAVAATGATVLTIARNGSSIGTINFGVAATMATFTFAADVTFVIGDILTITAPASPDATLASLGISLAGTRASIPADGGAPNTAPYIVSAIDSGLTAERVLTDTATITWDFSVAGQAKANGAISDSGIHFLFMGA